MGTGKSGLAKTNQERLKAKADLEDKAYEARDKVALRIATEGCRDQETLDAVLALGGDATRSSPVREQVLPDADPGLTTTTGAFRTPIDATTAAVPAPEHSELGRKGGYPTIGSGEHGTPEERWKGSAETPIMEKLNSLPEKEASDAEFNEEMAAIHKIEPVEDQRPVAGKRDRRTTE